jgi:DUF4097 and DUF4098 domain-containing protein YvlB
MSHTRANLPVTIMRRTFPAALAAALIIALPPLLTAQARSDSASSSRDRERSERDAERVAERAQRAAERATERMDRDDDDDDDRGGGQARTSIDTTVALTKGGVVDLSLISGEIRVVGWSRSEVKVSARSESGRLRFDASPSRVSLDVEQQGGRHNHDDMDATYDVSVPTGTRVLMRGVSGDLTARGVKGEIEARTVSGEVEVEDAGRVTLESVSGDVKASRVNGEARAHSVSGEVSVIDVAGDIDAESVSGDVTLRRAKARTVRVETVSGDVTYDGSVDPAGRYDFNSHSGGLRLILPANTNAALSLETFSGDIDSAFPLTLRPSSSGASGGSHQGRRMEFTLGSGGPRITAESFSGEIVIERAGSSTNK